MPGSLPSIADLLKQRQPISAVAPVVAPVIPPTTQTPHTNPNPEPVAAPAIPASQKIVLASAETSEKFSEKMGVISLQQKEDETQKFAGASGFEYIDLKGFPINADALVLVPEEQAKTLQAVAFLFTGPELRLGAVDPTNKAITELAYELGERHKTHVGVYTISTQSLEQAIKLYAALPKITHVVKGVQITESELDKFEASMTDVAAISEVLKKANVTDILAAVIAASVKLGSSDVHIEAEEKGIAVRFRVDGILQEVALLDREQWKRIINRIKLIASLKMNVTDQAQDGRFSIFQKNKTIDVRTSTIPTSYGESVVMRLLNPDSISLAFEELGFRAPMLKKLQKEV